VAKSRTITGGFMLINFTSPTCVTVTDAEEAEVEAPEEAAAVDAAPGIGGAFKGEAPGRPGIVGKATGALLTTSGAGAITGAGAGAGVETAGAGTVAATEGRTKTGAGEGAGADTTGAGLRPGTTMGAGALRGVKAIGALGALAIGAGIVTDGGIEAGRGGKGAGALATGAATTTAAGAGVAGTAGAGFKAAAFAWAATSFSRATSCVLLTNTPEGIFTLEGSFAATGATGSGTGTGTTLAPNSFSISSK